MSDGSKRTRRRTVGWAIVAAVLPSVLAGCGPTTTVPAGADINEPAVSPGAVNNGVSIGPSESLSVPPAPAK